MRESRRSTSWRLVDRLVAAALLLPLGCASASIAPPVAPIAGAPKLAVLTPLDGVPVRARDALVEAADSTDLDTARTAALVALRGDLAGALQDRGLPVAEVDLPQRTGKRPKPDEIAALGRATGTEEVVFTELVAYGDIRRSWIWLLAGQALLAGVGHGVAVAAATGDSSLGWWAGGGEFLLETATWVGGALVGRRAIDPVVIRVQLIRSRDGAVLGHWTREGTRPIRRWFRRKNLPPRAERLRAVADRVLTRLAPRLTRRAVAGTAAR